MHVGDYLCLAGIVIVDEASKPPFAQAVEQFILSWASHK